MNDLITALQEIITPYQLHQETKGFHGYYLFKKKQKKLVFFVHLNTSGKVYLGVSHWGTSLLKHYPFLKVSADQYKKAILKRRIDTLDDIERKGIANIISACYTCYTEHDGYALKSIS